MAGMIQTNRSGTGNYTAALEEKIKPYLRNGYTLISITPTSAEVADHYKIGKWGVLALLFCPFGWVFLLVHLVTRRPESCYFNVLSNGEIVVSGLTLAKREDSSPGIRICGIIGLIVALLLAVFLILGLIVVILGELGFLY
jgi:hypothetical protein